MEQKNRETTAMKRLDDRQESRILLFFVWWDCYGPFGLFDAITKTSNVGQGGEWVFNP